MKSHLRFMLCGLLFPLALTAVQADDTPSPKKQEAAEIEACAKMALAGFRHHRQHTRPALRGQGDGGHRDLPRRPERRSVSHDAVGRLVELLGHGRPVFAAVRLSFAKDSTIAASPARCSTWSTSASS